MTDWEIAMNNSIFLIIAMFTFLYFIWPEIRHWTFVSLIVMLVLVLSPLLLMPLIFTKVPEWREDYEQAGR